MTSGSIMAKGSEPDPMRPGRRWGFPILVLFGNGEATLILAAALAASGGPISWLWPLGTWLLAEAGWPALRWLLLEFPWDCRLPDELPTRPPLPYLQPDSPADLFFRTARRLVREIGSCSREVPELPAALATALVALGVGIGLSGSLGAWLTLGVGVACLLARRLAHPGIREGLWRWVFGAFPWWLGLAGGNPSGLALLAGIPIGLASVSARAPAVRWMAWPLWVAWAVALGHGPGAYGLALIGLLLGEDRLARSPRARWLLWILALSLTAWVLRTFPGSH